MIGPSNSAVLLRETLPEEFKHCVAVVAMGGSLVPGQKLPFGPHAGFTPWPETNVKGDDLRNVFEQKWWLVEDAKRWVGGVNGCVR